jgi:hypothetical protein
MALRIAIVELLIKVKKKRSIKKKEDGNGDRE